MGFLGGSSKAAAVLVGAFVGFLAVGDSRLWGLEFEAEVTILATFLKIDSINAFCSIKAVLLGNVPEEYRGASSQSSSHGSSQSCLSIEACLQVHPPPRHSVPGTGNDLVL